jgi:hypothetical protein
MKVHWRLGFAGLAIGILAACGDSGPTSSSGLDLPKAERSTLPAYALTEDEELAAAGEDFSCFDVDEVRARFGAPGFVQGEDVGFYVFFSGVPQGPKRLRLWWDYQNDPATFEDHRFAETQTLLEEVYQHRYSGLQTPTEFLVRVELILDGLTGNCPRNRSVLVVPPGPGPGSTAPSAPATQTANVGPPVSAVTGIGFGTEGVRFTVLTPLTIDHVQVNVMTGGSLTIDVEDVATSTIVNTTTIVVSPGVQQIPLGFSVVPGSYILSKSGTANLGATLTFGGVSYPLTFAGVISLTDSIWGLGSFFGYYYYFYDWQVTW